MKTHYQEKFIGRSGIICRNGFEAAKHMTTNPNDVTCERCRVAMIKRRIVRHGFIPIATREAAQRAVSYSRLGSSKLDPDTSHAKRYAELVADVESAQSALKMAIKALRGHREQRYGTTTRALRAGINSGLPYPRARHKRMGTSA